MDKQRNCFYQCHFCKKFFNGKNLFMEHKASCTIRCPPAKMRKVDMKSSSASSGTSSPRKEPCCTYIPPRNEKTGSEERETDEYSSSATLESSRNMESGEEQDLPLKITSVFGYGGESAPVVVKKEDIWEREKATIPVLLEKIKVEHVLRNDIPLDPKSKNKIPSMGPDPTKKKIASASMGPDPAKKKIASASMSPDPTKKKIASASMSPDPTKKKIASASMEPKTKKKILTMDEIAKKIMDQKTKNINIDWEEVAKEIETARRLEINLEPITDSICKYVFKSAVKTDKYDEPVIRPPTSRQINDADTQITKLSPTLSKPAVAESGKADSDEQMPILKSKCSDVPPPSSTGTVAQEEKTDTPKQRKATLRSRKCSSPEEVCVTVVSSWNDINKEKEKAGEEGTEEKAGKGNVEEKVDKEDVEEKEGVEEKLKKEGIKKKSEKEGVEKEGMEDEISPACSYINALGAPFQPLSKRKRKISSTIGSTSQSDKCSLEVPSHITLLTDEAKPVYQCNFCQMRLYNETQFLPHKQCHSELAPKPKGRKKRYCICRNIFEGEWKIPMIQCTLCRKWYHGTCMGLSDDALNNYPAHKSWECYTCKLKLGK